MREDRRLARFAPFLATHHQPRACLDVAAAPLQCSKGERPAPHVWLAGGRVVGPYTTTERPDEAGSADDDHVGRRDRLSGRDTYLGLAAHAPWRVDTVASHLRARHPGFLRARRIFLPEHGRACKHDEELPHGTISYQNRPMIRRLWLVVLVLPTACDKSGPLADLNAAASATASSPPVTVPSVDAAPAIRARVMPERPVPTTSPTVLITMPQEVQLQAIQYMAAMQAPQPSDAPADAAYAKQIADQLRAVGRTDVISSGRRIDVLMDKGCDATLPRESIARHTGASLTMLLTHGVLVIRCADHAIQCLQSTREANDVLCTHK